MESKQQSGKLSKEPERLSSDAEEVTSVCSQKRIQTVTDDDPLVSPFNTEEKPSSKKRSNSVDLHKTIFTESSDFRNLESIKKLIEAEKSKMKNKNYGQVKNQTPTEMIAYALSLSLSEEDEQRARHFNALHRRRMNSGKRPKEIAPVCPLARQKEVRSKSKS